MPKEIFTVRNRITLQAAIVECSEAAGHSHPFSKISLTVQSSDYILKWLQQECFLGNLLLGLFRNSYPQPFIFKNFFRKYRW